MTKLETILAAADAAASLPAKIKAEIAALETERDTLEAINAPTDKELARLSAVSVLLTQRGKALASLDAKADAFAVLNSPKGAAALGELLQATRAGLRDLQASRMASAQKVFVALTKADAATVTADAFYTAADTAAELWVDVGTVRAALASVESLAPLVATARPGGSWHFASVLEILRPAAVIVRVL